MLWLRGLLTGCGSLHCWPRALTAAAAAAAVTARGRCVCVQGPWTAEDDKRVVELVSTYGAQKVGNYTVAV
jgi:hypothetical protein